MPNSISVNYSHTNEERKYVEAGITKDNKIAYRNNGSYYVIGEGSDGFKNIPATDVSVNYLISAPGGRKGNPATRVQNNDIANVAEKKIGNLLEE